jgi:hypothetical protein
MPGRALDRSPVVCPFRRITGLPCPSCGLTRSWNAALHGRMRESIAFHPLGLLTIGAGAAFAAGLDKRAPELTNRLRSRPVFGSLAAIWVIVWLTRVHAARAE